MKSTSSSRILLEDGFDQPQAVSEVDIAFPARAMEIMPAYRDIPSEFKERTNEWVKFQATWFSTGWPQAGLLRNADVDSELAYRHLSVIQGSYAPKHEHKMAAVAWLASRWFKGIA